LRYTVLTFSTVLNFPNFLRHDCVACGVGVLGHVISVRFQTD